MLEHIALLYLNETLESLLYNRQHGFRKGLWRKTQLCATYHDLAKSIEKGSAVHGVVLDFRKAFDKVPHNLLMQKIRCIDGLDALWTGSRVFLLREARGLQYKEKYQQTYR